MSVLARRRPRSSFKPLEVGESLLADGRIGQVKVLQSRKIRQGREAVVADRQTGERQFLEPGQGFEVLQPGIPDLRPGQVKILKLLEAADLLQAVVADGSVAEF